MKTVSIVNPAAGRGQARRAWPALLETLGPRAGHVATWWTAHPGHAETLAARARREGFERVIAAGGDGTLLEVLNGLWEETTGTMPVLGMAPFGTGCDYLRSFDVGAGLAENLHTAAGSASIPVDVGVCRLEGLSGEPVQRVFLNVLGLGFDGGVVRRLHRWRGRKRGAAAYVLSALRELLGLRSVKLSGQLDEEPFEVDTFLLVAALGRYFGGGMQIAPGGSPQADRFQLVWADSMGRAEILLLLGRIYSGLHLRHPKVHARYARRVKLRARQTIYVQAEGELIGRAPVELEILPGAIRFAASATR